ncbi:kinase-like protein [Basidiobolus meristosporus CBS 931.73]|uniref:Kinase-like protein n=1 Tax=Basidiobolus meristosporus CBS 931.73 TaxID=1314790 RepID=A0A1Y1Z1M1_9FUNG|nr:kinase-like protein [Basidiobolus meristosporus CBS 931.73]|eukprot:ORY04076.1 kinase-like protein [Basidiobolus meristosporus CBS 931.73]
MSTQSAEKDTSDHTETSEQLFSVSGKSCQLPKSNYVGCCRSVDEFEKLNRVGEGTYGIVYRVRDKITNEILALKKIRMDFENEGLPLSSLREIMLLKKLNHKNIVNVTDVAVGRSLDSIFMVMEYCQQEIKCLMLQLLKGLEFCHDNFIVHRDLKVSNLLLNSQGVLKIADFGLARTFSKPPKAMTPRVVTLWYRAPELLLGEQSYTTAVDMWSVGCIFGELLKHKPFLPGKTERQQLELIIKLLGTPNERIWRGFNRLPLAQSIKLPEQRYNNLKIELPDLSKETLLLLNGLLTYDPEKRFNVKKALTHPYFREPPTAKDPSLMPTFPEIRNEISERAK